MQEFLQKYITVTQWNRKAETTHALNNKKYCLCEGLTRIFFLVQAYPKEMGLTAPSECHEIIV